MDCQTLLISSGGTTVDFLDLQTGKVSRKLEPQAGGIKAAIFSTDGKTIATLRQAPWTTSTHRSEHNYRIQVADAATGKQLLELQAIQVLEQIGSPEARPILASLAQAHPPRRRLAMPPRRWRALIVQPRGNEYSLPRCQAESAAWWVSATVVTT